MKKECRILITTECNLSCEYCCNKIESEQEKIKMSTLPQILEKNYDVIKITGGEPLLSLGKLWRTIHDIKKLKKIPEIYIYTNMSNERIYSNAEYIIKNKLADGFSISSHDSSNTLFIKTIINKFKSMTKLRISFQDVLKDKVNNHSIKKYLKDIPVTYWTLNDCDKKEDRYII
jgi:organic radical activating enzyme